MITSMTNSRLPSYLERIFSKCLTIFEILKINPSKISHYTVHDINHYRIVAAIESENFKECWTAM